VLAVDVREDKLRVAASGLPGVPLICADAGLLPFRDRTIDVVVCTEVLEHLTEPGAAVDELARVCAGRCVVSVPWEPWFRLGNLGRGKNLRRLGDDPEHVNHFNRRRLALVLAQSFGSVEVSGSFPWLVADARRPR
jgi:SAM-dependent methyltransferase